MDYRDQRFGTLARCLWRRPRTKLEFPGGRVKASVVRASRSTPHMGERTRPTLPKKRRVSREAKRTLVTLDRDPSAKASDPWTPSNR
jgi:hypothetical protein